MVMDLPLKKPVFSIEVWANISTSLMRDSVSLLFLSANALFRVELSSREESLPQ